jgi:hypothetical protein
MNKETRFYAGVEDKKERERERERERAVAYVARRMRASRIACGTKRCKA